MKKIVSLSFAIVFSLALSFGQTLEVIDDGGSLKFKLNGTTTASFTKSGMTLQVSGNILIVKASNGETRSYDYTKVINPTYASVELFRAAVADMLDTSPTGSGLTNTELRATPVAVSGDFATQATLLLIDANLTVIKNNQTNGTQTSALIGVDISNNSLHTKLSYVGNTPISGGQSPSGSSLPVVIATEQIGTAGTPALEVLSIQGISGMEEIEIKNTFGDIATADNQTNGLQKTQLVDVQAVIGDPIPANALLSGGKQVATGNLRPFKMGLGDQLFVFDENLNNTLGTDASVPTYAIQVGGFDGAAMRFLKVKTDGTLKIELPTGEQTITSTSETTSGTVTAGATSVTFVTNGTFAGTINGTTRLVSASYVFTAAPGKTLAAISYTVTVGSVNIDIIE